MERYWVFRYSSVVERVEVSMANLLWVLKMVILGNRGMGLKLVGLYNLILTGEVLH